MTLRAQREFSNTKSDGRLAHGEKISMIAKLSALLYFSLLIAISVIVFGRLSKLLVFDSRKTALSLVLGIVA
jgi:hypothetical protein